MKKRMLSVGIVAILLFAMAMVPAGAASDLKITDYNLNSLQNWGTWTQYKYTGWALLRWEYGPSILDATYQKKRMVGDVPAITVADMKGGYWGECVSLVKALSKSTVATDGWAKGDNVVLTGSVKPGTAIATFNSAGVYSGHVAIFRDYVRDSGGKIKEVLVWDQNYVSPYVVGRHNFKIAGSGVNNASSYYVVRV
ncbi:MAG: BPSL0067 family protein [Candidatus Paceibacterota bacterium]|jgi:hypothetical protein